MTPLERDSRKAALERINEKFRRRTKTQASLLDEHAVLLLLYGLLRTGQIVLRRIDGRNDMPMSKPQSKAARDAIRGLLT